MTLRRPLTALLVAATVTLGGPTLLAGPAHASAATSGGGARTADEPEDQAPLTVQLMSMTPSTVPAKGRLTMVGTVTNSSDEDWQDINVDPFIASTPITSRDELEEAVRTDPTAEVGTRLTDVNKFDPVGDLAPGESSTFRISLPRKALPIADGAEGVYWIGVHALGANSEGRDLVADGRARTFIPLVGGKARTSAAVVLPLRAQVRRDPAGRLFDQKRWDRLLAADGRLDRIVGLAGSADGVAVNWLVDPAVLDAAQSMAEGNPELALGETPTPGGTPSPSQSASASPSPTSGASTGGGSPSDADRASASDWLHHVQAAAAGQSLFGLGYADPDISALARLDPKLIKRATDLAITRLGKYGLTALPTVSPPDGWFDEAALNDLAAGTQVLISDHGRPQEETRFRTSKGQPLVLTDARAASGGPAPTKPLDALAVRQRILAEAALRALAGQDTPMVVSLPPHWNPGANWRLADFFKGLDTSWLNLVSASPPATAPTYPDELPYPDAEKEKEIGPENTAAARGLIRTGGILSHLLNSDNEVSQAITGAALSATSYDARGKSPAARNEVNDLDTGIRSRMAGVKVVGTNFVTLSGPTGVLTVTLVNDLDHSVTVGVRATTSTPGVNIEAHDPVEMGPGQRSTLQLHADADVIGVHAVTLTPVTKNGEALGTPLEFSLRTSQVGKLIWYILIAGGALLVVMIIRRIVKRIRDRKWRT